MPRERRVALYLRAGLACAACGWTARTLRRGARLSIDHLVAHSLGGDNGSANLVVLCGWCNSSKGARSLSTWLARGGHPRRPLVDSPAVIEATLRAQAARPLSNYRDEATLIVRAERQAAYQRRKRRAG